MQLWVEMDTSQRISNKTTKAPHRKFPGFLRRPLKDTKAGLEDEWVKPGHYLDSDTDKSDFLVHKVYMYRWVTN